MRIQSKTTSQQNTENKYAHYKLEEKGGSETWLPTLNLGTPLALFHLVSFLEDYVTCKSIPHLSFDTLFHFVTIHCDGYFFFVSHFLWFAFISFPFFVLWFFGDSLFIMKLVFPGAKKKPKKKKIFLLGDTCKKQPYLHSIPNKRNKNGR
jgi:hypothetical protein